MNTYELTVILRKDDVEGLSTKVKDSLQKHDVSIVKQDDWGIKRLAYEISNEREAYYMFMIVESDPAAIDKILADFRLDANILRYLFVKIKATDVA